MRPDRFITLNLIQPFRRAFDRHHAVRVTSLPVLMYHSISDDSEPGTHPYYRVCTSPQRFREQMQWLKDNGYRGVTLSKGLEWLEAQTKRQKTDGRNSKAENGDPASEIGNRKSEIKAKASSQDSVFSLQSSAFEPRPVVLAFDDGFQDFHIAAWPVLREFGFTATMYLPTAFIGDTRRQFAPSPRRGEGRGGASPAILNFSSRHAEAMADNLSTPNSRLSTAPQCLTWSEVCELHAAGIEFGSHTVNHSKLVELPWADVELEIRKSKSEIEGRLGVSCPAFAYPYAFPQGNQAFAPRFRDLLAAAGHRSCVTTGIGRVKAADNPYELKRLPVNSLDDAPLFAAKLAGSYDWLGPLQAGVKRIKSAISRNRAPHHSVLQIAPVPEVK